MSTYALKDMFETTRRAGAVPITPRGRALHTLDWFANGKRSFINYDDPRVELKYIVRRRWSAGVKPEQTDTLRRKTTSTIAIEQMIEASGLYCVVPATPRGRALHTLDWYANGKQTISNYDDPSIKVQEIVRGR
ncbi:MAG: hypothetical protein P8X48_10210 [Acidiferrobacteraceae bacterium]